MDKVIKAEEDFYKDQNSYKLISFYENLWKTEGFIFPSNYYPLRLSTLYFKEGDYENALKALMYIKNYKYYLMCESRIKTCIDQLKPHVDTSAAYQEFFLESERRRFLSTQAPANAKSEEEIGCLPVAGIVAAVLIAIVVIPIITTSISVPKFSKQQLESSTVTSVHESRAADTSTSVSSEESAVILSSESSSKKESSKTESNSSSIKSVSSKSASIKKASSKNNSSKKVESKKESDYMLDFDSAAQYSFKEYNIDGLEVDGGRVESVIRGGNDGDTLVVKVSLNYIERLDSTCYGIVDDLIKYHGFDKGSKIDFWATYKGSKVKSFVLDSLYYELVSTGQVNGAGIKTYVTDEFTLGQ